MFFWCDNMSCCWFDGSGRIGVRRVPVRFDVWDPFAVAVAPCFAFPSPCMNQLLGTSSFGLARMSWWRCWRTERTAVPL